jgi:hypothetical protein
MGRTFRQPLQPSPGQPGQRSYEKALHGDAQDDLEVNEAQNAIVPPMRLSAWA